MEATAEVVNGIDNFERSLKNFTYDDSPTLAPKKATVSRRAATQSTQPPSTNGVENDEETQKYMHKIKVCSGEGGEGSASPADVLIEISYRKRKRKSRLLGKNATNAEGRYF